MPKLVDFDELLLAATSSNDQELVIGAGRLLCAIHCGLPEHTEACWAKLIKNGGLIYSVLGKAMRAQVEHESSAASFELSQLWKSPPWSRPALDELVNTELLPRNRSPKAIVAKTFVALQGAVFDLFGVPGDIQFERTKTVVEAFDRHLGALSDLAVTDPISAFRLGAPVETQELIDALPEHGGAVGMVDLACYTDDGLLVHLVHREKAEVEVRPIICQAFNMDHALNLASVYRRFLLNREAGSDPEEALEYIAKMLHDRLWCHLARMVGDLGLSQLIVVPDAWTRALPHHLARVCGKEVRVPPDVETVSRERLADLFPVEIAATVQAVAINQWQTRPRRIDRIAILADPQGDLPGARHTAAWMRERFAGESDETGTAPDLDFFEGPEATIDRFASALADSSLLVYAGHGDFIGGDVGESRLSLADGHWSVADLQGSKIAPGSVQILAACEVGTKISGETAAAHALPGALVSAGSATVLAALWVVEDLSFGYLTERFLYYLSHPGYRPSAALFRAMNNLKTWPRDDVCQMVRDLLQTMEQSGAAAMSEEYAHLAETLAWLEDEASDPPFSSPLYWGAATVFGGGWSWPAGAYTGGADAVIEDLERILQAPAASRAIAEKRYDDAWEATRRALETAHGPGRIEPLCNWAELELRANGNRRFATTLLTRARLLAEAHEKDDQRRAIMKRLEKII